RRIPRAGGRAQRRLLKGGAASKATEDSCAVRQVIAEEIAVDAKASVSACTRAEDAVLLQSPSRYVERQKARDACQHLTNGRHEEQSTLQLDALAEDSPLGPTVLNNEAVVDVLRARRSGVAQACVVGHEVHGHAGCHISAHDEQDPAEIKVLRVAAAVRILVHF